MIAMINTGLCPSERGVYSELTAIASVAYFDGVSSAEQLVELCKNAEVIVLNTLGLNASTLMQLPKLKVASLYGTGFDRVDLVKARELGVTVCNAPDYGANAVAQHTVALIFELCNNVGFHFQAVREQGWQSAQRSAENNLMFELAGKTVGLLGFGAIGRQVAKMLSSFGVKILVHNRTEHELKGVDIEYVSQDELFRRSNIVSLHMRLNEETDSIVTSKHFSLMKENAFLINTARGGLINEDDLVAGLKEGKPFAVALDVTAVEPLPDDSELLHLPNCIITPHIAWNSSESILRLAEITKQNIFAYYKGEPCNAVN